MSDGSDVTATPAPTEVRFQHSADLPRLLADAGCALLVSTYQAGQVVGVGTAGESLTFSFRRFDRAMGMAVGVDRLAVAGKDQVWILRDHSDLAPAMAPTGTHDRCWLPRSSLVTGNISAHEVAWGRTSAGDPDLWVVNTRFSCLVGLDDRHSFVPRWRPSFISRLAPEDRCHLNGLAMRDGGPAFVTVMALADEAGGWRADRNQTGTVLDVASGEVVTTGLAMPHSPRWHRGQLYVLNSGMGRLERVDPASGQRDVVALLPGYARGLAMYGDLAFVGLSRIRETTTFGGTPLAPYHDQLRCGVGVVELSTGRTVGTLEFANGVEEIFDVQVVAGTRSPTFGGSADDGDDVWVLPAQAEPA
ncbi:TIGR03032 family protein [Nocardioides humilatus]|uniref:TIGR03032 family protein n=1 Tax=Nocardioides humilatus TaxID=2607660 RepID=A0A5B1LKC8_9ACTN|nr:TIGR03032 family protein [Nocardioides humilatus]KAA1421171.1 TIGR03032 family protein [Nocardioides humilatus]